MFGHLLLNLEGGGGDRHTCNMEGGERAGACPWWGRAKGALPPPPTRNWKKKMLSEEILTLFTYVLLMKLGGIDTLYKQSGRVGGQTRVHSRGGRGGLAPPPLKMGKKCCQKEF